MGDVDMLGRATEALEKTTLGDQGDDVCERVAREVLQAAGVLGADAQPRAVNQAGEPSMHDHAAAWLWTVPGARLGALELCVQRLSARKAFGLAKYGTALQIGGPRDPREDAIDELVDALVYTQQGCERAGRKGSPDVSWWMTQRSAIGRALLALMQGPPS